MGITKKLSFLFVLLLSNLIDVQTASACGGGGPCMGCGVPVIIPSIPVGPPTYSTGSTSGCVPDPIKGTYCGSPPPPTPPCANVGETLGTGQSCCSGLTEQTTTGCTAYSCTGTYTLGTIPDVSDATAACPGGAIKPCSSGYVCAAASCSVESCSAFTPPCSYSCASTCSATGDTTVCVASGSPPATTVATTTAPTTSASTTAPTTSVASTIATTTVASTTVATTVGVTSTVAPPPPPPPPPPTPAAPLAGWNNQPAACTPPNGGNFTQADSSGRCPPDTQRFRNYCNPAGGYICIKSVGSGRSNDQQRARPIQAQ